MFTYDVVCCRDGTIKPYLRGDATEVIIENVGYKLVVDDNLPVTGEFPSQRQVTRSFDLHLNKRLSKQSRRWWFETPSRSLWRHCDENLWNGKT